MQSRAFATTFDWKGGTSTPTGNNWITPSNWAVGGVTQSSDYPGRDATDDIVRFGVAGSVYTTQPSLTVASTDSLVVGSIIFGTIQYSSTTAITGYDITGTVLTVNTGKLVVTGDITQSVNTSGGSIFNVLMGSGTISCNNIQMGAAANSSGSNKISILISLIKALSVKTDVKLNLNVNVGTGVGFRLENGTMTIGNKITFIDNSAITAGNATYFTVNARRSQTNPSANILTNPTLILNSSAAVDTIPTPNASVNFYGDRNPGGKATVIYRGASPLIYTTSKLGFGPGGGVVNSNAATDPIYDNLIIQGTGTAVIGKVQTPANTSYLNIDSTFTTNSNVSFSNATNTATKVGATGSTAATWTNNSPATVTGGAGTIDINGSLSNSGTMTMGIGALSISKNYTNTGTFTPNATPTITFDGTTQALTDATATGTNFYNVTFTGGGTKSMASGNKFTVAPLYTLNVNSSSTLAVGSTSSTTALTLKSTLAGDASIADMTNGTITGNINVQRFVRGNLRRYMLLSSPLANASASTYDLKPLKVNTWITGPNGSATGYDFDNAPQTGNSPSVFIYDENSPLTQNPNSVINNEYKPFATMSETVPIGNGFLFYFRGDRSVSNPFSPPFPASNDATLNFFGAVFKGGGTNGSFSPKIINFSNSPIPTYYSTLAGGTNLSFNSTISSKKGFNMIGNPYASVIDLKLVYSGNSNRYKFFYMLIKDANTGTNSSSTRFAVYDALADTAQAGSSRYALSGQGFFVQTAAATPITFTETMKVAYSAYLARPSTKPIFNVVPNPRSARTTLAVNPHENNAVGTLAAATPSETTPVPMPWLRMELMKDSLILNTTDINFDKNSGSTFKIGEDAPYISSSGQGDFFYSQSADSVGCFINYTSDLEKLKQINLVVTFSNYGVYKLTAPNKKNIDERYTIFLKDKFTNDSLDVVHNPQYSFNVTTNKASYAHDRFYLSIGIAPGHEYKLLDFTGAKVTTGLQLNWRTDNESNFTRFMIEKSSDGGKSFTAIDSLQSTGAGKYTIVDEAPGNGQLVYRLKQNLVTGKTDISKNLVFNFLSNLIPKFIVYPSNATQNININFGKTYSDRISVSIISATGSLVKTITASNTDSVQQDVGNLLKGLYIVEATDEATGKRIGSTKFFKQ
ncbi:T9SS type A sorting domain-containing protein [Mucilaginibacter sabulilitoris]|uniref:T9SS type A sorting domain-containing protein n=1 Tax=Mucilaginibacter sabulilitoris TaxID=1173583 RepID=A0ABZ0TTZ5_9SPHI|nr:T9SS type A sorting domain-containing protein [Mucilaginibacter sabulilitoris]WPU96583.1 T9SS type A sorting domain-containing protein [Mucilaginibacter sabulilitoris]